jgi:hypothetical protein
MAHSFSFDGVDFRPFGLIVTKTRNQLIPPQSLSMMTVPFSDSSPFFRRFSGPRLIELDCIIVRDGEVSPSLTNMLMQLEIIQRYLRSRFPLPLKLDTEPNITWNAVLSNPSVQEWQGFDSVQTTLSFMVPECHGYASAAVSIFDPASPTSMIIDDGAGGPVGGSTECETTITYIPSASLASLDFQVQNTTNGDIAVWSNLSMTDELTTLIQDSTSWLWRSSRVIAALSPDMVPALNKFIRLVPGVTNILSFTIAADTGAGPPASHSIQVSYIPAFL